MGTDQEPEKSQQPVATYQNIGRRPALSIPPFVSPFESYPRSGTPETIVW